MSEIINIKDEREKEKNKDKKKRSGDVSYSESARAELLCCGFTLGFNV